MIGWLFNNFGTACGGNFLFFPTWYKYLGQDPRNVGQCTPYIHNINDIWLIVAAIIEILLRVAALVAVVFVIWAGFEFLTSESSPDKVAHARSMLINALVGLVIAVLATATISFLAGSIH